MRTYGYWISCWLMMFPYCFTGQYQNLRFKTLPPGKDGLTNGFINCIYKDKRGFLWFGTPTGLCRYDGYTVKTYFSLASDTTTLTSSNVLSITEDADSNFWLATDNGLNYFNYKKEKFVRYFSNNYPFVITDYIPCVLYNQNKLWIATSYGLSTYEPKTKKFKIFSGNELPYGTNKTLIVKLISDKDNNIYLLGANGCFVKYHTLSEQFVLVKKLINDVPFIKQEDIYLYNDSTIYIAFGQYVYLYHTKNNSIEWLTVDGSVLKSPITSITSDLHGNLWMVSTFKDLIIIDPNQKRTIKRFKLSENRHELDLDPSGFKQLYTDNEGIIWLGSYENGISFYHPQLFPFRSIRANKDNNKSLSSNLVNAICETTSHEILIGSEAGLQVFNPNDYTLNTITSVEKSPILCIFEDSQQNIWVSTYFGKLYQRKKGYQTFEDVTKIISKIGKAVKSIAQDKQGNLWFGTLGKGVYKYNGFDLSDFKSTTGYDLTDWYVNMLYCDSENNLWIATSFGICKYNYFNHFFKTYTHFKSLKLLNIRSIFKDSRNRLWFGWPNGLLLYKKLVDSIIVIDKPSELEKHYIIAITEDTLNHLWLPSNYGLLKLNIQDSTKPLLQVFSESNGLPSNTFRPNAIYRTSEGLILIGSNNGLVLVNPLDLKKEVNRQPVYFTTLRVFNNEIEPHDKVAGRVLLSQILPDLKHITLSYRHNIFSVEFAALSYLHADAITYQYKLDGLDTNWVATDSKLRLASYSNLYPGEYTLIVKAFSDNELIGERKLHITILPPFWKSNIAKILYAIVFLGILLLLRETILRNERRRLAILHEREEAQRIHNLDMLKINFFTNISHELRTPLTLILAPIERLISENKSPALEPHLQTIKRNAMRLLHLVNQLLDFRKLDAYGLEYIPSMNDIVAFSRDIVHSFTDMAEAKAIKYIFNTNVKELLMEFDLDKYNKILFNLLSNAFKYTPEKGAIAVELNFHEEITINDSNPFLKGELILKVKDTGIGIPPEMREKIFEQFVQAKHHDSPLAQGTGIGLALVKEYVRLHNGTITLESELEKGSCFTIRIPVTKTNVAIQTTELHEELVSAFSEKIENYEKDNLTASMLIVEDNEELRFYLKDNFKYKYKIYEANNGQQGLSIATTVIPDIIVTDVMLPIIDGITLCRKLKNDTSTSHIPVIVLTALNTEDNQIAGIEAGADEYIVKPFNFKILEARINQLIEKQKQKQISIVNKVKVEPKDIEITSLDEKFIQKAFDLVEKNINNPNFTVELFSSEMGMSRMLLYKKLMALTGKSPIEFIRTMRLKRAAQLLEKSQLNVSEVAIQVGFNDAKYFSQCFKKEFNLLPSEYQKKYANIKPPVIN